MEIEENLFLVRGQRVKRKKKKKKKRGRKERSFDYYVLPQKKKRQPAASRAVLRKNLTIGSEIPTNKIYKFLVSSFAFYLIR